MFCQKCGGKLESYASNCAFCGTPVPKLDAQMNYVKEEKKKEKVEGMTTVKWIGLTLLPCIPLIGVIVYLVLMFKWAFGTHEDVTLKGFARANLFFMLIGVILAIAFVILALALPDLFDSVLK